MSTPRHFIINLTLSHVTSFGLKSWLRHIFKTNVMVLYQMHEMYKSGPSWKDLKHVQLLDDRQREDERRWDEEFIKRRQELEKQRQLSSQRRVRTTSKLSELSARWRNLEQKRVEKNEFYLERLRTSLSLVLRQESLSSGSPFHDR